MNDTACILLLFSTALAISIAIVAALKETEKNHKEEEKETNTAIAQLKKEHNLTYSYVNNAVWVDEYDSVVIGLSDDEKTIFVDDKAISYWDVVECKVLDDRRLFLGYKELNNGIRLAFTNTEDRDTMFNKLTEVLEANKAKRIAEYNEFKIPENFAIVGIMEICADNMRKGFYYTWNSADKMYFRRKLTNWHEMIYHKKDYENVEILRKDIVDLRQEGEIHYETKISGGDNPGMNLAGAVVGGVLAGGTGAIIGSRAKTNPINSATYKVDDRQAVMITVNDRNRTKKYCFRYDDYYVLSKLINTKK